MQHVFITGGTIIDGVVYRNKLPDPTFFTIHAGTFTEGTGSTGAGKALNLAKLGVSQVHSVIGNDSYAH